MTFALFAFNQERYIRDALEGAFCQTYEPLEIILSDDCSSDRTFEIMQEMSAIYDGPHDVQLRRNRVNLGIAEHVNVVFDISHGDILLLAAGDDISLPDRTKFSVNLLEKHPSAMAIMLSADVIDDSGTIVSETILKTTDDEESIQEINDLLEQSHANFGATRAIRRDILKYFGPLNKTCPTEDTPFLLRSLMCGTNVVSGHKGILYRKHDNNLSRSASLKAMDTEAIYNQYKDDIDKAKSARLITESLATQILRWQETDKKLREIRLKRSLNEKIFWREVWFWLRNQPDTLGKKIKFILKKIRSLK